MAGFRNLTIEWEIRIVIAVSLGAHGLLALLAGIRRREATGLLRIVLWLAYQVANWAAPFVLSNLSVRSTRREQQLVAFWLPSLVAHLGGPDNITAYSLEDNKTFLRQFVTTASQLIVISFAVYKEVKILGAKGTLFWASVVMVGVGVCKYLERLWALSKADFGNIRSSGKKKQEILKIRVRQPGRREPLNNEQALLVAHELLDITKGAFADYSVDDSKLRNDTILEEIFPPGRQGYNKGWENMCKVTEMELSLMYDILYTKAAVIHSWFGYFIRIISPLVTATVIVLFWFYSKEGQRTADVIITYVLLAITLLLDVRWLLGAAASTWTYAFFNASPARWLHHEVCCTRSWHRLRRLVVSLDPWQLPLREHGGRYRLWSATIGQYNMLRECTDGDGTTGSLGSWMANALSLDDAWMEYKYSNRLELDRSKNVKEVLCEQIQRALNMIEHPKPEIMKPAEPRPSPPDDERRRRYLDEDLGFLPEFQELILIWHVATDVFLLCSHEQRTEHQEQFEAIKAVSDYMAFLAAVRPDMLPGLKLRSLHQATRQALNRLWKHVSSSRSTGPRSSTGDEMVLVNIMKEMDKKDGKCRKYMWRSKRSVLYEQYSTILSDGVKFAELLQEVLTSNPWDKTVDDILQKGSNSWKRFIFLIPDLEERPMPLNMKPLLKLILKAWVRMLIYASIRCGRDSHAKQLSRGCELTTIVWILSEHAGIFAPRPSDGR